ncbi:N-acyl amino acid synthase FeeM domain-containing protein [Caballeronia sp.]|uniref:N-acyl amino acid synthase FeeM domain-containing protein n=1 Tax=Caballeronia sp. TaxID=1931223 RepID=UPI003C395601
MHEANHTVQATRFSTPSYLPPAPAAQPNAARSTRPSFIRHEARLPFTVRVVADDEALERALKMRQAAYQRHVPEFARTMDQPESYDREPGGLVFLAESKLTRNPVGTMRIQSNRYRSLALQTSVALPEWVAGRLVGATRLGVEAGEAGRMVKTALFKAFYLYCMQEQIDWMVIAARAPLDRQYAAMLFRDVYGEKEFIPLAHAANIPHRIMAFEVGNAERRWHESRHPLYDFMVATHHRDIDLSAAPSLHWPDPARDVRSEPGERGLLSQPREETDVCVAA